MSELQDLDTVIEECRQRINAHDPSAPIEIPAALWNRIEDAYLKDSPQSQLELIGARTIKIMTPSGKKVFVSAQELPQIWGTIPYARAVLRYEETVDRLATDFFGYPGRNSGGAEQIFKKLPSAEWRNELQSETVDGIDDFLSNEFNDPADRDRFRKFLGSKGKEGWSGISKELSRSDWLTSAIPFVGEWLAVGAAERGELVVALADDPAIESGLADAITQAENAGSTPQPVPAMEARLEGGANILFYGAPGTGKSHDVWEMIDKDNDLYFLTVFHPDMQNSDFAGTLKPGVSDTGDVTYAFRPGPFAKAVANAWANPAKKVYLIIEELNRAVAAAVFGELFQLLDREPDGSGRYEVDFPSPEFEKWFDETSGLSPQRLSLPSNLWILATMNSADQGVYPLDTAFRRRWRQNYLAIDYFKAPKDKVGYVTAKGPATTDWRAFVETLNEFLVDKQDVGEDRLVGPRFLNRHDLADGQLPGKLLIYLWDDLLRHHGRSDLFDGAIRTYGDLDRRMKANRPIFSSEFLEALGTSEEDAKASSSPTGEHAA